VLPVVDLAAELDNGESTGHLLAEHWSALVAVMIAGGTPHSPPPSRALKTRKPQSATPTRSK
jgi:hypothetical protein